MRNCLCAHSSVILEFIFLICFTTQEITTEKKLFRSALQFVTLTHTLVPLAHLGHKVLSCPVLFVRLSICPSCPCYHSTAHNIHWILSIFGTANNLGRSMNPIDYGVVHSLGSSCTLKSYRYTDWLASWTRPAEGSRPLDGIFLYIFDPCYSLNITHRSTAAEVKHVFNIKILPS